MSVAAVVASLSGLTVVVTLVDPDQQMGNALPTLLLFLTAVGVCVVAGLNVRWLADNPGAVADARLDCASAVTRPGGAETAHPATAGPAAGRRTPQARPTATPAVATGTGLRTAATPAGPIPVRPPAPSGSEFTAPPVVPAPQSATFTPVRRVPAAAGGATAPSRQPVPAKPAPVESVPAESVPAESVPAEPGAAQIAPAQLAPADLTPAEADPAEPAAIVANSAPAPAGPPAPDTADAEDAEDADHSHDAPRDGDGPAEAPTRAVTPKRVVVRPRHTSAADKNSSGATKGKDAKVTPKRVAGRQSP